MAREKGKIKDDIFASDNDRRWFEAHPGRRYRLRRRFERECEGLLPPPDECDYVIVRRLTPEDGMPTDEIGEIRVRPPFRVTRHLKGSLDEHECREVWIKLFGSEDFAHSLRVWVATHEAEQARANGAIH